MDLGSFPGFVETLNEILHIGTAAKDAQQPQE